MPDVSTWVKTARRRLIGLGGAVALLLILNIVFAFVLFPSARREIEGRECGVRCEDLRSLAQLQLCFSAQTFRSILAGWERANPGAIEAFRASLWRLDFVYPVLYGAFLALLYFWATSRLGSPRWWSFPLAAAFAAGFDWAENILTLVVLSGRDTAEQIPITGTTRTLVIAMSTAAAIKWALATLAILGSALAVAQSSLGRVLWTCRYGMIAVALGSLPFIVVPQGRDILRGLVEAETRREVRFWSFFFLAVWAISVWYWARVLLLLKVGRPAPKPYVVWVPRVLGTLALLLPGIAFLLAAREPDGWNGLLVFYGLLCLLLAGAALAFVVNRRQLLQRIGITVPPPLPRLTWTELPRGTRRLALGSLGISVVMFLLFTLRPVQMGGRLGTLAIVFAAAANAVFFGNATVYLGRLWRVPLVTLALLLAAAFSFWNDNHFVRLAPLSADARPTLPETFSRWLQKRRCESPQGPVPVFLVAAEGGGIRAAYWTATALARIQDQAPGFARHVFAISGVSGGSLGAAVFDSLVAQNPRGLAENCSSGDQGALPMESCAQHILAGNFLAPTLGKMLVPDFAQWFVPFPVPWFDRAWALEDSWARAYEKAMDQDRLSLPFLGVDAGQTADVPALLLNVAHVQWGRRLLHAPFRWTSKDFPDTYDMAALLGADVPLKTAVHNSARFAYVSPAGRLRAWEGEDLGHVVDGGYFENSGAASLRDLWVALERQAGGTAGAAGVQFYVLYLCNSPLRCGRKGIAPDHIEPPPQRRLAELSSPLRALLGAREARGSLAIAELKDAFGERFIEIGVCARLAAAEKKEPLPLGWQLSKGVRENLATQLHARCGTDACAPCLGTLDNPGQIARVVTVLRDRGLAELPAQDCTAAVSGLPTPLRD